MVAIILVLLFILGIVYVRSSFINMFVNVFELIRKGSSSGLQANKIFVPSFLVFFISILLFGTVIIATVYPRVGNIFYQAYLDIMPQNESKGNEVHEGFLLEAPYDSNILNTVITKQELLQRLQGQLNRISLPPGLSCSTSDEVSVLAIEGYLKRLLLSTSKTLTDVEFEEWTSTTHTIFMYVCKERKYISQIMDKLHQDARNGYSTNELRTMLAPLLKLYNTARVKNNRYRSRKEVNDILGIPIGELDPRNETALKGINSFKLKTSIQDTGDNTSSPSDYSDPFMYFSANDDPTKGLLPTQTNDLGILKSLSHEPIPRANVQTRGNNS